MPTSVGFGAEIQDRTMSELTWSSARPEQEGWFWLVEDGAPAVVRVFRYRAFGDRLCTFIGVRYGPVDEFPDTARWAGPIPLPVEQPASKE